MYRGTAIRSALLAWRWYAYVRLLSFRDASVLASGFHRQVCSASLLCARLPVFIQGFLVIIDHRLAFGLEKVQ
jgi:hypothetical protein